jgi:hypothetical protein
MSNRTIDQVNEAAEYRVSHLAQIEALTMPGLNDYERVKRFGEAVGEAGIYIYVYDSYCRLSCGLRPSPARAVWELGKLPKSLFADLPGCECPVFERLCGGTSFYFY